MCNGGSVKWLSWKAIPVLEDDTIYAVARDVTERKKTEEAVRAHLAQLAHVLRLHTMGEMASQISHELNQPLGAVVNYARGAIRLSALMGLRVIYGAFVEESEIPALITNIQLMLFGGLIMFFLVVEPDGLNKLWNNVKDYFKVWPFPYL